jgi:pimeloyl-ACP methyl ester carboxylesterase
MLVLLVHGLGRTPLSMFGLAPALRRAGHHTRFFAYSPTFEPLPRIVRRLTGGLRELARHGRPIGLVGHSLGGLLLRLAVAEVPELPVHRLVMLGTPNRPPRIARWAWRRFVFRGFTRGCGRFLACPDSIPALPIPAVPYTLIAGTAGPRGIWSPYGDEPNDGIVAASELPIRDADSPLLFPVWHSFMMNDRAVKAAVRAAMMTAAVSGHHEPRG